MNILLVENQKVYGILNLQHNIGKNRNKIGIKFNSTTLAIEQSNFATKIVNVCIIYDLDNWPKNPLRNFALNSCLFGATNIVKNDEKEKYVYIGYGIAFIEKDHGGLVMTSLEM